MRGTPPFDLRDLAGAALLGLMCGIGARGFAVMLTQAKRVAALVHPVIRIGVAGGALVGLYVASKAIANEGLTLGAGYRTVAWALDPRHALAPVVAVFFLRALATTATVAGGGAGGLFIPLVIQGVLVGRAVGGLFGADVTRE